MAIAIKDPSIPDEVRRDLNKYNAGQNILTLLNLPGYEDLLNLLREDITAAKKKLETYRDSDAQQALRLLAELQGKEDALTYLERKVKALTGLVENPTPELRKYIPY